MDRINRLLQQLQKIRKGKDNTVVLILWDSERGIWIVNGDKEFSTQEEAEAYACRMAPDDDGVIIWNDADVSFSEPEEPSSGEPPEEQETTPENLALQEKPNTPAKLALSKPQEIYNVKKKGASYVYDRKWFRSMEEVRAYISNISQTEDYLVMVEDEQGQI